MASSYHPFASAQLGRFAGLSELGQVRELVFAVRPAHAVDQVINVIEPAGPRQVRLSRRPVTCEHERLAELADRDAVAR